MSKCVYCLKEIGDNHQECPFCGFPVSVPFTVKNVKQKWKQDMYTKSFRVEPSLDAMHRAEKAEQEGGQQQQRERQAQRPPQRPPQQNRPHPQQPWGQAPQFPPQYPQYPQYPQNPGYPAPPQGYGYPQASQPQQYPGYPPRYPQNPQYPPSPQYPTPQYSAPGQNSAQITPQQAAPQQEQQKTPIPNHTAPQQQPTPPTRTFDAEFFNDWLN